MKPLIIRLEAFLFNWMNKKKYVIIVAGGSGSRMNSDLPKQFITVGGQPILMHTLSQFKKYDRDIALILVLPESQITYWNQLCKEYEFDIEHNIIPGGQTRYHSVKNGLDSINSTHGYVAIHDGVRMFISTKNVEDSFVSAQEKGSGVLAVAPKDSLREISQGTNKAVDRSNFQIIQTPQTFDLKLIKDAFLLPYQETFTDDANVFEAAGHSISLVEGNYKNIKITTPEDLIVAEAFLTQ